jgi:uncharacterized protein YjiS (DUF1127 family)
MLVLSTLRALRNWLKYRRTLNALQRLDDRALRDIGLTRSGLVAAAKAANH